MDPLEAVSPSPPTSGDRVRLRSQVVLKYKGAIAIVFILSYGFCTRLVALQDQLINRMHLIEEMPADIHADLVHLSVVGIAIQYLR